MAWHFSSRSCAFATTRSRPFLRPDTLRQRCWHQDAIAVECVDVADIDAGSLELLTRLVEQDEVFGEGEVPDLTVSARGVGSHDRLYAFLISYHLESQLAPCLGRELSRGNVQLVLWIESLKLALRHPGTVFKVAKLLLVDPI